MKRLIYGAGGLGREILDLSTRINIASNQWESISFIDDIRSEKQICGAEVLKFEDIYALREDYEIIIAQGEPAIRELLYQKVLDHGMHIATLIDPTALISPTAKIGRGSIIFAHSVIASNVTICENVLIQPVVIVGHDIYVGKHSVISTGVSPGGADHIGERVYIGMNTTIREKITIGDDTIIGMGSVVQRDIDAEMIVMGNPARPIQRNVMKRVFQENRSVSE